MWIVDSNPHNYAARAWVEERRPESEALLEDLRGLILQRSELAALIGRIDQMLSVLYRRSGNETVAAELSPSPVQPLRLCDDAEGEGSPVGA
jgi:hypothetical protein